VWRTRRAATPRAPRGRLQPPPSRRRSTPLRGSTGTPKEPLAHGTRERRPTGFQGGRSIVRAAPRGAGPGEDAALARRQRGEHTERLAGVDADALRLDGAPVLLLRRERREAAV
jgi:hypothetical protein